MDPSERADASFTRAFEAHLTGRLTEAEACYREALALVPEHANSLHYLGLLSYQSGNVQPGLILLEHSVRLCPDVAAFYNNLANAYRSVNRREKAVATYRQALRRNPGMASVRANLGTVLWEMDQHDAALAQLEEALRTDRGCVEAVIGKATVLKDLGRIDEALEVGRYGSKLAVGDNLDVINHNQLYALNFHTITSPGQIFEAHREWAAKYADPLTAAAAAHPAVGQDPERRLKIGYVSAYFRGHAINFFMEPVLSSHDRARFEITCYSDVAAPDFVTARLRSKVDRWFHIAGLSHAEVAERIRADGIDILVDLSGHMGTTRLMTFARKPAPVQVTYLGYQATTGLAAMDYRLTDAYADPPGQTEAWHTEKLVRLPDAFFCYHPPGEAPEVVDPPCLQRKHVTFGSFNIFAKVTPQVLATWAKILARVPGSRLQLLVPASGSLRQRVLALMADHKVVAKRIDFVPRAPRQEYLLRYQTVDIALDPFPFNSHTTSCDALWMGVPTVMWRGRSYVQRYGGVALVNLGLDDLIADSLEAYVETAVGWAADPARLTALRRTLRERMRDSVICDEVAFTRRLENAYREMWRKFCAGVTAA